jgi:hypothetical protein
VTAPAVAPMAAVACEGLELQARIGEGRHANVFAAHWRGQEVAVKVYRPASVARHRLKFGGSLAGFEFARNAHIRSLRGMARFVAEPLGHASRGDDECLVQERLHGPLYFHYRNAGQTAPPGFKARLTQLVAACHVAGIYDLDLHAMNVIVQQEPDGELIPRLFDFNMVPYTLKPRNAGQWLMRLGILPAGFGDYRRLARLDDFRGIPRRHAQRYFHHKPGEDLGSSASQC